MRTRLPCVLLALLGCAHRPTPLGTPAEVLDRLERGEELRVVVFYARCQLLVEGTPQPSVEAVGGFTVSAFEHFARGVVRNDKAYLATSETRLIIHPRHGPVFNYARLRLYEDGVAEVTARYLTAGDYRTVMDETFLCRLGDSALVHATP